MEPDSENIPRPGGAEETPKYQLLSIILASLLVLSPSLPPAYAADPPKTPPADPVPSEKLWGRDLDRVMQDQLVGRPAPLLKLSRWYTQPIPPSNLADKIIVLHYWSTNSPDALTQLPFVNQLHKKCKDQAVLFLGVCSSDSDSDALYDLVARKKIASPLAQDHNHTSATLWRVTFIPSFTVIDRRGIVHAVGVNPEHLETVIQKLLQDQPPARTIFKPSTTNPEKTPKPDFLASTPTLLIPSNAPPAPSNAKAATWGLLSDEQRSKVTSALKVKWGDRAIKEVNPRLQLYETKYFLFYSDIKLAEARQWVGLLDKMYNRMCEIFNLEKNVNIWWGKAVIFVFSSRQDYKTIEARLFNNVVAEDTLGLAHSLSQGPVIINFFRQPDDTLFAEILVHESTHGFLHRYRSPIDVPSWVNEGLAEVVASELVPKTRLASVRMRQAKQIISERGGIGKNFFYADQIEAWQYGPASSLSAFMIRSNKKKYADFINAVKDGYDPEDSLKINFNADFSTLLAAYYKSLGLKKTLDQ